MYIGGRRGESKGVMKKEILKSEWVKREGEGERERREGERGGG